MELTKQVFKDFRRCLGKLKRKMTKEVFIKMYKIMAYIERDPETGLYVGTVPEISGAHTQAETLDELQKNLKEVVELCLEEMTSEDKKRLPEFIGIQQIEVSV